MATISEIKEAAVRLGITSGKVTTEMSLANAMATGEREAEAVAMIEKKALHDAVMSYIVSAQTKKDAVANRTKHTFNTLKELNEFMLANNCGEYWNDENRTYSVYKYN